MIARVIINKLLANNYSATQTRLSHLSHKSVLRLSSYKAHYDEGPPPYPLPTRMYVSMYATVLIARLDPFSIALKNLQILDGSKYAPKNFPR